MRRILFLLACTLTAGCGSTWKIRGGVNECFEMCKAWNLDFSAMVGVGDQGRFSEGATACVCTLKGHPAAPGAVAPAAIAPAAIAPAAIAPAAVRAVQQQQQTTPGH